jgi:manganese/zinc/iron transport system permease protein
MAKDVIERHRLWETYLVNEMNLAVDHVHRDAEEMEHVLTPEVVEKLKAILKDPLKDPHGKKIK